MKKVKVVVATRASEKDFYEKTATGRSLRLCKFPFLSVRLFPENTQGLSTVYNVAIQESVDDPCALIFIHDDVHVLDYFWVDRILGGLSHFNILGLAGNKRRSSGQSGWAFVDDKFTWDKREYLSGVVGHGKGFPPSNLSFYGPPGQQVKLLDGLMLCVHSKTLVDNDIRFDETFKFHFYDIDFCRQAEQKNVTCGTWAISVIHESKGGFNTESWRKSYEAYMAKWGD
jgi:GT2 family glycosyltransferase